MKKEAGFPAFCRALVVTAGALSCSLAHGALFFSEYVEGSGYNKALEIYNAGESAADLSAYEVRIFFNGNTSASATLPLTGALAPGNVHVIAHSSAQTEVLAASNQTAGGSWFNGDDAIVLVRNGTTVDAIGQIGMDPGSQWGSDGAVTANRTLRRLPEIQQGDADAYDIFEPHLQWQGYPQDTFTGLGQYAPGGDPCANGGCEPEPPPVACGESATPVHALQGSGFESPLAGTSQTVEAVVVASFLGADGLNGFFVMEEEADRDEDPFSSEGLFVYAPNPSVDVQVGDQVRVTGSVSEYFGMTQISANTMAICASAVSVSPVSLVLPADPLDLERREGMLVNLAQPLTVTENYNLGRYGELVLSSHGRLYNPTQIARPGEEAQAVAEENARRRILLDDGSTRQNPASIPYPPPALSAYNTVRSGDTVQNLEGVVHYAFNEYRIQPTRAAVFVPDNPRRSTPDLAGRGSLRIASFNVLNYFNGDGTGGGFPTARGANTAEEFERQRAKIIEALAAMDADVVGLIELENDGYGPESAIADLVNGLEESGLDYDYVRPGAPLMGTDQITVGFIYKPARVALTGNAAVLDQTVDARFNDDKNRPVLAQTFADMATGAKLTVAVTHLKSKGSDCNDLGDPDAGDGQGNCNLTRTAAAQAMADWLAGDPTGSGDSDVLVMGDLNAYAKEDPIVALESRDYINLLQAYRGDQIHSYVYMGLAGYLDHALASPTLVGQVTDITAWHINADEPRVLDYNVEQKTDSQVAELYAPHPYRSSDHDPLVVELNLTPPATLRGDFNLNGRIDSRDLILLTKQLRKPVTPETAAMDLDEDGEITARDVRDWARLFREFRRSSRLG